MAKKMVFKKEDNLYYVATYTNTGDFSSISEKGYETAGLANISAGIPEGTPTGETVSDEVEVAPADPVAPTEEVAPVTTETTVESEVVELKEEVADIKEEVAEIKADIADNALAESTLVKVETVEVSEDGKTATFQDGSTAPIVPREEIVAQLGEETVAKMEAEALPTEPVAEVTAPAVEETAPVTA